MGVLILSVMAGIAIITVLIIFYVRRKKSVEKFPENDNTK